MRTFALDNSDECGSLLPSPQADCLPSARGQGHCPLTSGRWGAAEGAAHGPGEASSEETVPGACSTEDVWAGDEKFKEYPWHLKAHISSVWGVPFSELK